MQYTIYLRTNLVNGKQYVGQTKNFEERERCWACYTYVYANKTLNEDREKYGLDNWKVEILDVVDTRPKAWELEQKYITELNTQYPNGYNVTDGGGGAKGLKLTEDAKRKISEARKGKHNSPDTEFKKGQPSWLKGKHLSKETKKKLSEAHKGKKLSEETKKKLSEALKGKGQKKEHIEKRAEAKKKTVYQYSLSGDLIGVWKSAKDVSDELGFCKTAICNCCNGKRKTAGGFKWMYKKDYDKMLAEQAN